MMFAFAFMRKKGEKKELPSWKPSTEELTHAVDAWMYHTNRWATREAKSDLFKIKRVIDDLETPVTLEKGDFHLKYTYYMRPRDCKDYRKLLSPTSQAAFSGSFGATVRLYQCGEYIALETPGADENVVLGADVMRNEKYLNSDKLTVAVGLNASAEPILVNLEDAPHILIGGETGSGKSVLMHQMIISLLLNHSAKELQLYLVDSKRTEFFLYDSLDNVTLCNDSESAMDMLQELCDDMDSRYQKISAAHCRDIESYNEQAKEPSSRKVVFIDELSDLMMKSYKSKTESYIVRIAQLARACGIHLVIATQRPDRTVVTGLIKANIPTRICLSVNSSVNSNIILDRKDGKDLTGKGDLFLLHNGELTRCQAGLLTEKEIKNVVGNIQYMRTHQDA